MFLISPSLLMDKILKSCAVLSDKSQSALQANLTPHVHVPDPRAVQLSCGRVEWMKEYPPAPQNWDLHSYSEKQACPQTLKWHSILWTGSVNATYPHNFTWMNQ